MRFTAHRVSKTPVSDSSSPPMKRFPSRWRINDPYRLPTAQAQSPAAESSQGRSFGTEEMLYETPENIIEAG
jgi:hypothetical protein